MNPKAVIFDCDGVVVDSEPITFDLLARDLGSRGVALEPAELQALCFGGTMQEVYQTALALGADLPPTWVSDIYAGLYARLALGTPLIPGILPILDRLDRRGIAYAIGSNGRMQKMQITLGQHQGLIERFKGRLFSGQSLGAPKPAPDIYLHAARALRLAPGDCVVIEDSPTGARAARAAGMRCFGYAADGQGARLAAEGAQPFTDMSELPALLGI